MQAADDIAKSMANIGTSLMQNGAGMDNVVADIYKYKSKIQRNCAEDKTVGAALKEWL